MESLILKACHREDFSSHRIHKMYAAWRIRSEPSGVPDAHAAWYVFQPHSEMHRVGLYDIFFRQKETEVWCLFSEVQRLLQLLLVVPTSSATAERSFSCLQNYLKATESQARLNHLAARHTLQNKVDRTDVQSIRDTFVQTIQLSRDNRHKVFGSCLHSSAQ